ncbi:MAG: acetyl-CoA carboxylase carboxyl transferase subunit alpha [Lachnospiraceae bacterium]|nr:acetyl-CoA carboxylase carboxyl transferase subunit alpha [Lachnospiraceae bacterium]
MDAYERIKAVRKMGRATAKSYIDSVITGFHELHGDRRFADDHAIIGGIGWLSDIPVTVIGIEKGTDLNECMYRNFGCAQPEGYRKALRLMKQAEKFNRPIICFVDTQGAGCGKGAEERGAGQAIAENLAEMMCLKTPILTVMIGEGGSGGALALAVADEVWMLEDAYYSVISPEACASILYKDSSKVADAAECLKLFAQDLYELKIVEKLIPAPDFTNDSKKKEFMEKLQKDLTAKVASLRKCKTAKLLDARYEKYRKIGRYSEIKVK